jgi:hypothetical protein
MFMRALRQEIDTGRVGVLRLATDAKKIVAEERIWNGRFIPALILQSAFDETVLELKAR